MSDSSGGGGAAPSDRGPFKSKVEKIRDELGIDKSLKLYEVIAEANKIMGLPNTDTLPHQLDKLTTEISGP
jgi:hypothetical protein